MPCAERQAGGMGRLVPGPVSRLMEEPWRWGLSVGASDPGPSRPFLAPRRDIRFSSGVERVAGKNVIIT